jgi:hypothetical protein
MKGALALSLLVACLPWQAIAGPVYGAGSNGDLYTIIPTTGATTLIGAMGTTLYDIAEYGGILYGIDSTSDLYRINTSTGAATLIGATGDALDALTFNSSGVLYAAGMTESKLYTINLATGAATAVPGETNSTAYNAAGDLQFFNGVLYMTTGGNGTNAPSTLVTVNLATGNMTTVGAILVGGTAVDDVFGLAQLNGILYGFSSPSFSTGEVISINTSTGAATNVHSYGSGFTFYGTTSDAAPEPSTWMLMIAGSLLGGNRLIRRKGIQKTC